MAAIDLEAWVNRQASMDRLMLEKRMEGYSEAQVAFDLDQTPHRVRTRTRALGHELAGRVGVSVENSRKARQAASALK